MKELEGYQKKIFKGTCTQLETGRLDRAGGLNRPCA